MFNDLHYNYEYIVVFFFLRLLYVYLYIHTQLARNVIFKIEMLRMYKFVKLKCDKKREKEKK